MSSPFSTKVIREIKSSRHDPAEDSNIFFCKNHSLYFDRRSTKVEHRKCESYPLQWGEVLFYMNKFEKVRTTINELRSALLL